jgi:hypothetical protein
MRDEHRLAVVLGREHGTRKILLGIHRHTPGVLNSITFKHHRAASAPGGRLANHYYVVTFSDLTCGCPCLTAQGTSRLSPATTGARRIL